MQFAEYASCDSPFACAAAPVIARKWVPVVVCHLLHGPKRFADLRKAIPRISAKVLTENLNFMQDEMMIIRKQSRAEHPQVWYQLTDRGRDLDSVIREMNLWGRRWLSSQSGWVEGAGITRNENPKRLTIPLAVAGD